MTQLILVLGTDTAVGKTYVSCQCLRFLRDMNLKCLGIKPVETGVSKEISEREDGVQLAKATGQRQPQAAWFRFQAPLAPVLAAQHEGTTISFEDLCDRIRSIINFEKEAGSQGSNFFDLIWIESAGGLLSPMTDTHDAVDFLAHFSNMRVLLVGPNRLGVINQVRMAIRSLGVYKDRLLAVVLNDAIQAMDSDNVKEDLNEDQSKNFNFDLLKKNLKRDDVLCPVVSWMRNYAGLKNQDIPEELKHLFSSLYDKHIPNSGLGEGL